MASQDSDIRSVDHTRAACGPPSWIHRGGIRERPCFDISCPVRGARNLKPSYFFFFSLTWSFSLTARKPIEEFVFLRLKVFIDSDFDFHYVNPPMAAEVSNIVDLHNTQEPFVKRSKQGGPTRNGNKKFPWGKRRHSAVDQSHAKCHVALIYIYIFLPIPWWTVVLFPRLVCARWQSFRVDHRRHSPFFARVNYRLTSFY